MSDLVGGHYCPYKEIRSFWLIVADFYAQAKEEELQARVNNSAGNQEKILTDLTTFRSAARSLLKYTPSSLSPTISTPSHDYEDTKDYLALGQAKILLQAVSNIEGLVDRYIDFKSKSMPLEVPRRDLSERQISFALVLCMAWERLTGLPPTPTQGLMDFVAQAYASIDEQNELDWENATKAACLRYASKWKDANETQRIQALFTPIWSKVFNAAPPVEPEALLAPAQGLHFAMLEGDPETTDFGDVEMDPVAGEDRFIIEARGFIESMKDQFDEEKIIRALMKYFRAKKQKEEIA
ncbi:MAG: hypothetical protein ACLPID_21155 [Beijerinckiaceae bacterium]